MSELRGFDASLPMALLAAREAAMQHFRPLLAAHDLTEQQWRVLRALSASEGPVDVGNLVLATNLLAPSVSRILVNLEERELIKRAISPEDQRRSVISLSRDGQILIAIVAPESERIYVSMEKRFGEERLATLISELHDLTMQLAAAEG
jgi:homoprotocatechuate degradation regulator HpaR